MGTDEWISISEAAKEARVVRQAIFNAIKKGQIVAEKRELFSKKTRNGKPFFVKQKIICLKRSDLNKYRENKHLCEKRQFEGRSLFDIADDRWSVLHASKWFAEEMGRFYPVNRLYHLIRTGELPAKKHGGSCVLSRKDLIELYEKETKLFEEREKKWAL